MCVSYNNYKINLEIRVFKEGGLILNICILKESLCIGGTERSAANISKILAEDHNVFITLYDGAHIKYSYGGKLVDFSIPPKPSIFGKILNSFLRDLKLRTFLKRQKIDILYTFTSVKNFQTLSKYRGIVKVISARDFGMINMKPDIYKKALDNSDAMISNSEYTQKFYTSIHPEDDDKVFAVYNVIDVDDINRQATEDTEQEFQNFISKHKDTVVAVGRFCKEKGFEYLIKAFAKARKENKNLGLVLIGDGDYKDLYLSIIEQENLKDHIYFTGFQKNPYKYMAKCSAFVLSSLSEGFPNVLAEAMALGLPTIAANCYSGPAEILREDCSYEAVKENYELCDFGIITPRFVDGENENEVEQLSLALITLLGNETLRTKYAELSKQRVKTFSNQAANEKLNNIFNILIERRNKK